MAFMCGLDCTFSSQLGISQLCLSLHFLLVESLKVIQSWELRAFSGLSWAAPSSAYVRGLLDSQQHVGAFQNLYSPKCLNLQSFLSSFDLSKVCSNYYPLLQVEAANTFAFNCFWQNPPGWLPQSWESSVVSEIKILWAGPPGTHKTGQTNN